MAMPALKLDTETIILESSIVRLESDVTHIRSHISDLKGEVKRLHDKTDKIKEALAAINLRFEKLNTSRVYDRVWFLLIAAGMLAAMAKGFKWM
jgi:predicted nuclease with TOPRIM domain